MAMNVLIIILLVMGSAFTSVCETGFTSVNRIRLKHKAENGSKPAKRALGVLEQYDKALSTLLIGNNVVNITLSSIATVLSLLLLPNEISEQYGPLISTVFVTLVVLIFGEILPKTIARIHAERVCIMMGGILYALMWILTPVSFFFLKMQRFTTKLLSPKDKTFSVTEEELVHIIDEIEDEGVLEEHESSLVRSALAFDETTAGEILTPRVNITAVSINEDIAETRDLFLSAGYSRLPVYEKTLDHIAGIITIKDFMQKLVSGEDFSLSDVAQETLYVPSLMKISEVLKLMQKKRIHLAVVVDQYGGTEGIVTLEDILEELVGEIYDEDDEDAPPIHFTSDTSFNVSGHLSKNDFNRYFIKHDMDYEINTDANTVGGWVFELFGKIPKEKDVIKTERFIITVLSVENRRIGRLRFDILKPPDDE